MLEQARPTHRGGRDEVETDAEADMLFPERSSSNMRSKIRWFTEFCNSHYVSHFAAFFIVARAKISVVESCSRCRPPINSSQSFRVWFVSVFDMVCRKQGRGAGEGMCDPRSITKN